jgi:hypothetical protein
MPRVLTRRLLPFDPYRHEFFALGGVLINEEDEGAARTAYEEFRHRWSINYPLHSVEIRHSSNAFSWLKRGADEYEKFMRDLHLCQTAFSVVVERAAKYARDDGRKLRVMPERSSRDHERRIQAYFGCLREKGAPFDSQSSSQYAPLRADEFCDTLYELRFKAKSSPMAQVADLYLWPLAIAGYDEGNRAYGLLKDAGRLIESRLPPSQVTARGAVAGYWQPVS